MKRVRVGVQKSQLIDAFASPRVLLACLFAAATPASAAAANLAWNGYATIATDYVYRGVSMLDSGPSLQAGLEARADDTFVAGVWATNVDRQWGYQQGAVSRLETNLYTGTDVSCGEGCRVRFLATGYFYSGADAHNWQELSASIALRERLGASAAWSPHGLGTGNPSHTLELWYLQPLARSTSFEVGAGKLWIGGFGYWFAHAGVSQRISRWSLAATYHASDPTYARYGFDDRSSRLVLSVSTAF